MSDLRPLPADGVEAVWAPTTGDDLEQVTVRWDNEAWTAIGRLERQRAEYVIRLSPLWQVRQLLLFRDLEQPDLWLGTDGHGRWGEVNGAHRPELDGALDVTIAGAVFPHTIPVRRLPLHVGDSAQVMVLVVDVETLGVEPVAHRYLRTGAHAWSVSIEGECAGSVDFEVDEHGMLTTFGDVRRIA